MSGWDGRLSCVAYGLTLTKATYWHRRCDCGLVLDGVNVDAFFAGLMVRHLSARGFERIEPSPSPGLLLLTWPGAVRGESLGALYDAVSSPA